MKEKSIKYINPIKKQNHNYLIASYICLHKQVFIANSLV